MTPKIVFRQQTNFNTITDLLFFHSLTVEQMNNLWTGYLLSINFETLLLNVEALKGLFSSINALATSASYNDWNHNSVHQFFLSTWSMQTWEEQICCYALKVWGLRGVFLSTFSNKKKSNVRSTEFHETIALHYLISKTTYLYSTLFRFERSPLQSVD